MLSEPRTQMRGSSELLAAMLRDVLLLADRPGNQKQMACCLVLKVCHSARSDVMTAICILSNLRQYYTRI